METDTDKYDLGEEITSQVEVRKPTGLVVSARLEPDVVDRLMDISEATGRSISQVVREAVLSYIDRPEPQEPYPFGTHIGMDTVPVAR
jgi:hypothetical protein